MAVGKKPVSHRLLSRGLSSSQCGPLHRTANNMAFGFPLDERSKRESRSPTLFSDLVSEVMYYHFCHIILVTQTNPDIIWERIAQRSLSLGVNLEFGYIKVNWMLSDVHLDLKIDFFFLKKYVLPIQPFLPFHKFSCL